MLIGFILDHLVPGAKYFGVPRDLEAYARLDWQDERKKPTVKQLEAAWPEVEAKLAKKKLLRKAPKTLADLFYSAPDEAIVAFGPIAAAAKMHLDNGRADLALKTIENPGVAVPEELKPLQDEMLKVLKGEEIPE